MVKKRWESHGWWKIKKNYDLVVHIKSKKGDYGPVEDAQLIINHI